jgi:flagellar basal-body rod modification protein FlgD
VLIIGSEPFTKGGKMQITSSSSTSAASSISGTAGSTLGGTKQTDFMQMLLAQLKNQNPLEPLQDKDLMTEFTQLTSLQEIESMQTQITKLQQDNQKTYASSLIGKNVEASVNYATVSGVVNSVEFNDTSIYLNVGSQNFELSKLTKVLQA